MFLPFYILKLYTSNLSYLTNTLSLGFHQQICTHAKLNTKMLLLVLYLNFLYIEVGTSTGTFSMVKRLKTAALENHIL